MRKILIAFDGNHFSEGAFEFARKMSKTQDILLTGVFLPQVEYANLWSYAGGGMSGPLFVPLVEEDDRIATRKCIDRFTNACIDNNIDYRIHKDIFDFTLPQLKKETRFADLLIIGSEKFYENLGTDMPNDYLRDTLHGVECPVVVVPEQFTFPYSNVLSYDGSASSIYAIKQFAYLFPEMTVNDSALVYVTNDADESVPDLNSMEELAICHYPELSIVNLKIDPAKYFSTWLSERKGAILVSGSFARSDFSRLFRKSFVNEVINEHKMPVFIAHK